MYLPTSPINWIILGLSIIIIKTTDNATMVIKWETFANPGWMLVDELRIIIVSSAYFYYDNANTHPQK